MGRFFYHIRIIIFTIVVLQLSIFFYISTYAESTQISADLKYFEKQVAISKAFAEKRRQQAVQWQMRADKARKRAGESSDPEKKKNWLKDANIYDQSVEQALQDAETAENEAAQAMAEIQKIKKAKITSKASEEKTSAKIDSTTDIIPSLKVIPDKAFTEQFKLELEEIIGVWRFKGSSSPFVIIPEDPELSIHAYKLEAHTNARVWKGEYSHFDQGDVRRSQNARMVFKYKPKFNEMNPEIPEWARRSVENKLEWRIELNESGSEADPCLRMEWYPGEVRWSKDTKEDKRAEVIGDGEPRIFEIEPEYGIDIEDSSHSMLSLSLGGSYDAESHPIESLIKGQRFFIKVRLPPKLARKQGTSLIVSLKGLTGGDETTLVLTGTKVVSKQRAVVYTHDRPVTIADCDIWTEPKREPQLLSLFWIFGVEGACLDLDVKNGELVEVRFGESYQQIIINDSWVQRGIARHKQGADRMRSLFGSILVGDYTKQQKESAHSHLRMVKNYDALMRSDILTDLHRFHVGELYFSDTKLGGNIISMDGNAIDSYWQKARQWPDTTDPNFYNPLMQAFLEGISGKDLNLKSHTVVENLTWVSKSEKMLVKKTLRRTSKRFASHAVKDAAKKFTFGMYDGFVSATGSGDLYLVVTGKDHFGNPLPHWMRLNAALGLASSAVLSISGSTAAQHFIKSPVRRNVLGKINLAKTTLIARGTKSVKKIDDLQRAANLPLSLKSAKRRQAYLQLEHSPSGTGGPIGASRLKKEPKPYTIHSPGNNLDLLDYCRKEEYASRIYGNNVEFLDWLSGPVFNTQTRKSCNEMAVNYAYWKKTGRRISENDGHQRIFNQMHKEVQDGKRPVRDLHAGQGFFIGYDQSSIRHYLKSFQARVAESKIGQNSMIKLRHIWSCLKGGWSVKIIINVAGSRAKHAVIVDALEVSSSGQIVRVRVYDPNIGQVIRVPARDFNRIINRDNSEYGVMTVFRFQ